MNLVYYWLLQKWQSIFREKQLNRDQVKSILSTLNLGDLKKIGKSLKLKSCYKFSLKTRLNLEEKILNHSVIDINRAINNINLNKKKNTMFSIPPGFGFIIIFFLISIFYVTYNSYKAKTSGRNNTKKIREDNFKSSYLYNELSKKYPFGFQVFGFHDKKKIVHGKSIELSNADIQIDWDEISINPNFTEKSIEINVPKMSYKTLWKKDKGSFIDTPITFNQIVSMQPSGIETRIGVFAADGLPIPFFQHIDDFNQNPTYVIGFREMSNKELDKLTPGLFK